MNNMNLLPWRENFRRRKNRRFFLLVLFTTLFAMLLVTGWNLLLNQQLLSQNKRNASFASQVDALNEQLVQIATLNEQHRLLQERLRTVKNLDQQRFGNARLLDGIARAMPERMIFKYLRNDGKSLEIRGLAASNKQISELIRNLVSSGMLVAPELKGINDTEESTPYASSFTLILQRMQPSTHTPDASEGDNL